MTVTEAGWREFEENGFLVLKDAVTETRLRYLQSTMDDLMAGIADIDYDKLWMELDEPPIVEGSNDRPFQGFRGASPNYKRIQGLERVAAVSDYIRLPLFQDLCARRCGPDTRVAVFRAMLLSKPPWAGASLGWHQDYWTYLNDRPLLTTWLALDEATAANGCLRIIPGSHKLGHLNDLDRSGFLTAEMVLRYCNTRYELRLELAPGDVVVLDNGLLHASHKNVSATRRRALSVCYLMASTRNLETGSMYPEVF